MDQPKNKEIKIELPADVAAGKYSNFAVIANSPQEFFIDFVTMGPNMPQAKVQSRIIMTPENAKNLLFALRDHVAKYESTFGEITRKEPKGQAGGGGVPNPFLTGGKA